jgi:hypothetical protein
MSSCFYWSPSSAVHTNNLYAFILVLIRATCSIHLILLDLITTETYSSTNWKQRHIVVELFSVTTFKYVTRQVQRSSMIKQRQVPLRWRICGSHSGSYKCQTWRQRWYVPPNHRFTYGLHGAIPQKTAAFLSNLFVFMIPYSFPNRRVYSFAAEGAVKHSLRKKFFWNPELHAERKQS